MEAKITYFEKPGKENTDAVIEIAKKRAQELGIKSVVLASQRGFTAEKAAKAFDGMNIVIIAGFYSPTMENIAETFANGDKKLITSKTKVLVATHLFAGMSAAMRKKYQKTETGEIVAATLRTISTGIKVAVECTVMAADAGLVRTDEDIIAIGGTGGTRGGVDSAIVVRPVCSQDFFDIKVKEILCKPREW